MVSLQSLSTGTRYAAVPHGILVGVTSLSLACRRQAKSLYGRSVASRCDKVYPIYISLQNFIHDPSHVLEYILPAHALASVKITTRVLIILIYSTETLIFIPSSYLVYLLSVSLIGRAASRTL